MTSHVDTVFFLPQLMYQIPKIPKILAFFEGAVETPILMWHNPFEHWRTRSANSSQIDKMPLVNLGLTESQNWSKSSKNNIFHVSTSNPSYSEIFVNFD